MIEVLLCGIFTGIGITLFLMYVLIERSLKELEQLMAENKEENE